MARSISLKNFRLITFDVTNTLLQFRTAPGKQYGEIGALFGVLCDNGNDLAKSFKFNWNKMNRAYPNFGRNSDLDWQIWWQKLISNTFADGGARIPDNKLENFTNHLVQLYKTSICWQHCNGSVDLLNFLKSQQQLLSDELPKTDTEKPLVLGVVANFDPRLETLLQNMKIDKYFNFVINSFDADVEKPDSKIFQLAMERSNLKNLEPAECLHIGDGPTTDYLAAKAYGWHAALVHEKSAAYLIKKYGNEISDKFVFASLYDFHKKILSDTIDW